jgi:hypothetical protein
VSPDFAFTSASRKSINTTTYPTPSTGRKKEGRKEGRRENLALA